MTVSISSSHEVVVDLVAESVWQAISNFGDLSWAMEGGIDEVEIVGEGIGMVRKVRMAGMEPWIFERLVARDDDAMSMTYVIDKDGWPGLTDYVATAKVIPTQQGCVVRWLMNAKTKPADATQMQAGLDAMAEGLVSLFIAQFDRA